ncbi:Kynurenine formamidase [Corynebacterium atrinae]|uniref:cyclase family protein n=1 Tax=Corynebacterium atrinae TaxID=1336740 RepID=UPI0025B342A6|nr:cyclase family protein [Corynebacterium atrinae]WJY62840.1 Kynurenine formamidase [Corynebacterium atrinae]
MFTASDWVFHDLTRPLHPDQERFPTDPPMTVRPLSTAADDGFEVTSYQVVGPTGTHVDAPAHVVPGGRTLEGIPASQSLLPLIVLDSPDIAGWEERHGRVPAGCFAALRGGGWTVPALEVIHSRGVIAIGHDTLNTDSADVVASGSFPAQRWWLEHDHWQIENLRPLTGLPTIGAWIMVTWPLPAGGSAFPARVIALTPAGQGER